MALTVAYIQDGQVTSVTLSPEGRVVHAGGAVSLQPAPGELRALALPTQALIRRRHPKPFSNPRKLRQILPGLLADTLLDADQGKVISRVVADGPTDTLFTSVSVTQDDLSALTTSAELLVPGARMAAPLVWGLAAWAPAGTEAVLVAQLRRDVLAVAVNAKGSVLDFRSVPADDWDAQATLTLRTLAGPLANPTYIATAPFLLPDRLQAAARPLVFPQGLSVEQALLAGLGKHMRLKQGHLPLFPLADPIAHQRRLELAQLAARGLRPLVALTALLAAVTIGHGAWMDRQHANTDAELTFLFEQAMPGTPVVDPLAQLQARARQLGMGNADRGIVLDRLTALITAADSVAGLALDRVALTGNGAKVSGKAASVGDIETFRAALEKTARKATLGSANLGADGATTFQVEVSWP